MRKLEDYNNPKMGFIILIVVFVAIFGLFVFLFFNSISLYSIFDLNYGDLMSDELTFNGYEKLNGYKTDKKYIVYFSEFEKPFEISTISDKRLDKDYLNSLAKGEVLKVCYRQSSSKKYDYVICEFSHNSTVLLSLSDYVETNQNNQIAGMIVYPIMFLMALFLICGCCLSLKHSSTLKSKKENSKTDLGKVIIEYTVNDSTIRVCNSVSVCSLVINDKVVDRYLGTIAFPFNLSGKLNIEGKTVLVEAKMGHFYMRLYIDGKRVGKAFMGLG